VETNSAVRISPRWAQNADGGQGNHSSKRRRQEIPRYALRSNMREKKVYTTMQKQESAIYVAVSAARAPWYFLNRTEAFRQKFDSGSDVLVGYKHYDDAVKAGRVRFADEDCFAVLSISVSDRVRQALAMSQQFDESIEDKTKAPVWRVFSNGAAILAKPENAAMWVQYIATKVDEKQPGGGAGTAGKSETTVAFEPIGPTGFGC
jgi:hypothetical protein